MREGQSRYGKQFVPGLPQQARDIQYQSGFYQSRLEVAPTGRTARHIVMLARMRPATQTPQR